MTIMVITEFWNEDEAKENLALTGTTGHVFDGLLRLAGISRKDIYVTSVIQGTVKSNDLKNICGAKPEGIAGYPALIKGKYLKREHAHHLTRLYKEIQNVNPNLIIVMGALSAFALLHSSGIKAVRGAVAQSESSLTAILGRRYKVLPTYNVSAVMRDWTLRPVVIQDLDKAKRQSISPEFTRPRREIWIKPTLQDLVDFEERYIKNAMRLSIDIETKGDQLTCIGFAPNPDVALVVPFYAVGYPQSNYWPSAADEIIAWEYVRKWCQYPALFQNGMYDIHFLWRRYGIPVPNAQEDTMLLHHAYQPEMEKGLGFLGTIYTDEASWKKMGKSATIKKGDE